MSYMRQAFYLLLGFSFPWFWMFHSSGFWAGIYAPLLGFLGEGARTWLSLISALIIYILAAVVFETAFRLIKNARP